MNYQRANITGIDAPIYSFQNELYKNLKTTWGCNDNNFNMYGRAYTSQTKDGYVPELFKAGIDYTDTLFDDRIFANAFFGVGDATFDKNVYTANVFLVFMVNLKRIKPGSDRNDEPVHVDVQKLLPKGIKWGFAETGFVTGIEKCFKEYNIELIKFRDQHPLHCFRVNFKLSYTNQFNC